MNNGLRHRYEHDMDGRRISALLKNGSSTLQSLVYKYDTSDRIARITNAVTTGATQDYSYDKLSRLKKFRQFMGT